MRPSGTNSGMRVTEMGILILKQIIKYVLMMLAGFLVVKCGVLESKDSRILSVLSVYLILPCAIIHSFQIEATSESMQGLLFVFAAAVLNHVLMILLAAVLGRFLHLNGVEQASAIYSNAGNMILPLVLAVFGEEWVLYASANMSVQLIFLWTHGKHLICREQGLDWKKIFLNINILAILVGLAMFLGRIGLPATVKETMGLIGSMLAPLGMLSIGMVMGNVDLKKVLQNRRVYLVSALRVVVFPLAVLAGICLSGAAGLIPAAPTLLFICFLAATTSVSTSVMQMSQVYGADAEYAGQINILTTLLCLATMPVLAGLFEMLFPV